MREVVDGDLLAALGRPSENLFQMRACSDFLTWAMEMYNELKTGSKPVLSKRIIMRFGTFSFAREWPMR